MCAARFATLPIDRVDARSRSDPRSGHDRSRPGV